MAGYIALFVFVCLFLVGLAYIFRLLFKVNMKEDTESDPLLDELEVKAAVQNLTSGKVLAILLYAVTFFGLIWFMFYHEPDSKYQVMATNIFDEFRVDKIQANAKYRDEYVTITGKYVGDDLIYGSPAILLKTSSAIEWVQCNFEGRRAEQAESLSLGQEVSLKGKVLGKTKNLVIEKCSVSK